MNVQFDMTQRQAQAWDALHDPQIAEVCYGGAKGGGKSFLGVHWVFARCLELIQQFGLTPREHPVPVGFMGRKQGVDLSGTTLETWKRFIPPDAYTLKEQAREIIIGNAVKVDFGGLDRAENVQKFNSAEYAFFFIDQAEEVLRDDISVLRGSLRLQVNGITPDYKALFTANPAQCWLKHEFVLNPRANQRYVQALPSDNKYLDAGYVQRLREAFGHRPELLEAYLHGSWDDVAGGNQVIFERHIREAIERRLFPRDAQRFVVCDVARFGDDETVMYPMCNTRILETDKLVCQHIYGQKDTMHTANLAYRISREMGDVPVVVDAIGVGAGVADRLRELGATVYAINSAEKASEPDKFYNLRAEMWWRAGEQFAAGDVDCALLADPALIGQLCTPGYELRNGRIIVESKEDIKKRLGKVTDKSSSPDRADTYVMGLHALRIMRQQVSTAGVSIYNPPERKAAAPAFHSADWFDRQEALTATATPSWRR